MNVRPGLAGGHNWIDTINFNHIYHSVPIYNFNEQLTFTVAKDKPSPSEAQWREIKSIN